MEKTKKPQLKIIYEPPENFTKYFSEFVGWVLNFKDEKLKVEKKDENFNKISTGRMGD